MLQTYALQAITTRYLGPTNTRGGRIQATCAAGSHTAPYDHALSAFANHAAAARALVALLGWMDDPARHTFGSLKDGYVLVISPN
jgi:hypothetical protein